MAQRSGAPGATGGVSARIDQRIYANKSTIWPSLTRRSMRYTSTIRRTCFGVVIGETSPILGDPNRRVGCVAGGAAAA